MRNAPLRGRSAVLRLRRRRLHDVGLIKNPVANLRGPKGSKTAQNTCFGAFWHFSGPGGSREPRAPKVPRDASLGAGALPGPISRPHRRCPGIEPGRRLWGPCPPLGPRTSKSSLLEGRGPGPYGELTLAGVA